jgi:hypothetical protein
MIKYKMLGILFWMCSSILIGFQIISDLIGTEDDWAEMSIMDVAGEEYFLWIDDISWVSLQRAADYIFTMPLCFSMFFAGLIFLAIGKMQRY